MEYRGQQQQQGYSGSHPYPQSHPYMQEHHHPSPSASQRDPRSNQFSESTASLFSTHQQEQDPAFKEEQHNGQQHYPTYGSTGQQQQQYGRGSSGQPYSLAASTSMADLAHTNNIDEPGGKKGKKPPRVYNTAFGEFAFRDLLKKKFWKYYVMLIVLGAVVGLAVIYHDDIIEWFQPIAEKIRDLPGGWSIFVGVLFIISFPPLAGHEFICLLCGLIYGLWIGFAIVALGTMLGEWGNFVLFKWGCTARSKRWEETDVTYACICKVIREGGFRIAFMARLSAIPGHLTTPAFAACGMSIWVFSATAFITLPKQMMTVYLGTIFGNEQEADHITPSKIAEWVILGISFIVTIWAAYYIYVKMGKWRPVVLQEQAEKKAAAEALANGTIPDLQTGVVATSHMPARQAGPGIIVTSPSSRTNRSSMHGMNGRWPFYGGGERSEDSTDSRLEEGNMEEARSPLVRDAPHPAGYQQGAYDQNQRRRSNNGQDGLYPVKSGETYASSEEEEGYGYADGGEAYTRFSGSPYDRRNSRGNSLRQQEQEPTPYEQYEQHGYASHPSQQQRQQQQQPYACQSTYLQSDQPIQDLRIQPHRTLTPEHAPASEQAEEVEMQSNPSSAARQQRSPPGPYPTESSRTPQPRASDDRQRSRERQPQQPQQPPHTSSYPGMHQPRPISSTNYHSRPPAANSTRYHSNSISSSQSPYHTSSSPAPTYHTTRPPTSQRRISQSQQQQQQQAQYPPTDAPPRYQTAYRQ